MLHGHGSGLDTPLLCELPKLLFIQLQRLPAVHARSWDTTSCMRIRAVDRKSTH